MTTFGHLRRTALALPGVEERTHFGMPAFYVGKTGFATRAKDDRVQLRLDAEDVERLLAEQPTAERLTRGATLLGATVPLADVNGQALNHWLRRAWTATAPKRLVASAAAADVAAAGEVGDLPKRIGTPATRALTGAGITTLAQVADLTDAELTALHGVGPRAVRILREVLADVEEAPDR